MTAELLSTLEREVLSWPGVTMEHHPGGRHDGYTVPPAAIYRLGRRELGHVHDTGVADLPVPRAVYAELIAAERAEPHPAGFAGVVTYAIRTEQDVPGAIELFRKNYERARDAANGRGASPSGTHPDSKERTRQG